MPMMMSARFLSDPFVHMSNSSAPFPPALHSQSYGSVRFPGVPSSYDLNSTHHQAVAAPAPPARYLTNGDLRQPAPSLYVPAHIGGHSAVEGSFADNEHWGPSVGSSMMSSQDTMYTEERHRPTRMSRQPCKPDEFGPRLVVGSERVREASRLRRGTDFDEVKAIPCPWYLCTATFTQKHNLECESSLSVS